MPLPEKRFVLSLRTTVIVLVAAGLAGLGLKIVLGPRTMQGDFAAAFITESARYEVRHKAMPSPDALPASWTLGSDANGFQLRVTGLPFDKAYAFLTNDLGMPLVFAKTDLTGWPHAVWGAASAGGAVQCIGTNDGFEIICVKSSHSWSLPK